MLSFLLQGWRSWKSAKSVALLAAAALAIGIGSATAIYTVVDAVLLRPLPWLHGERFVSLFGADASDPGRRSSLSWLDLLDYQKRTHSFDVFGVYQQREFNLTAPGPPQHLQGVQVTPALLNGLGVNPILGRWFADAANDTHQAVISSRLWSRLGSDPNISGKSLTLDGRQYTVTGVAPAWFRLPLATQDGGEYRGDVWLPLNPEGSNRDRDDFSFFCYARLKPGVTIEQADADVKRASSQLAKDYPKEHPPGRTAFVINLREIVVKEFRPSLLLLFGAAGVLLLITCANVAGLLLARSVLRARETAIRVALGAAQWQLALLYLAEGLLVALAGAAGGVLISLALVRLVRSMAATYLPLADGIRVNWTALWFALGCAVAASALLALAPLWQAVRTPPNDALSEGTRASAAKRSRGLSRSLVVAEIALAFTLLAAGALLLTHLDRLLRVAPGFDPEHVLTFSLNASQSEYGDLTRLAPYQKRLLRAVEQIPAVSSAALVNQLPIEGCCYVTTIFPEGRPPDPKFAPQVSIVVISPGYFETMRIPLLKGRLFDGGPGVDGAVLHLIVDQAAAKLYWPDRDAIGAYARTSGGDRLRVIGVVGDVRNNGLGAAALPEIYLPATQAPVNPMRFVVRSASRPAILIPELQRAIGQVNPAQPLYALKPMREIIQDSVGTQRLESFLTAFFASVALLLAALGVYGVVSYSVRHRTVEIGTRMALGAASRDVLRLVIGDGLGMAAWGIGIGAIAVAAAAWLLSLSFFGVHVDSPAPFLYSAALIVSVAALACFFPAWRATLVSPLIAIRGDTGSIWRETLARISNLASSHRGEPVDEGALLAKFVDASHNAESFRQAIQSALATLRETLSCESARLLEKGPDAEYKDSGGCSVPQAGLLIGRLRNYSSPLPLTEGDLESSLRWAAAEQPRHTAELASLRASGARLAVALRANQEIAGILLMGAPIGRAEFDAAEKRVLRSCAPQFALMIENAHLTDRIVEQEKLRRDVQLAVEVQKRLMPEKPPASTFVSLAGMSLAARSVGGDYYDFLDLGNQRIGIALADVAGKGVAAALIMSVVQASLRILATDEATSLSILAARMNHFLHRSTGSNAYATFFYAQIDQRTRQLHYVNAGHNPPFLLRYSAVQELPAGGTVIGLFAKCSYEEASVDLLPGDVLLAFTDGVPEALNPSDEEFGEDRLRSLLIQLAHLPADEMVAKIASELKTWIADAVQYDDLTFILVKVNAESSSEIGE